MITEERIKFQLYLTVLRFLAFKLSRNTWRIYLDVDLAKHEIMLTAYYLKNPSEQELEWFDDIVTNSKAHIPDMFIRSLVKLTNDYTDGEHHDFIVFAFGDDEG